MSDEKKDTAVSAGENETAEKEISAGTVGDELAGEAAKAEAEDEVAKLKNELAEQQAKYLYLQAEYQNFRKRTARDISDARNHAVSDTLMPFLNVVDFLAMAGAAAEKSDNLEALKQGLLMIIGQFDKALEELGVKKMECIGEKFDPELHDAVSHEPSETVPEGCIIRQWNSGFKLGEKLLRPARVLVSSGKKEEDTPAES